MPGALGCSILLVGRWEALGIVLLSNRQVRTAMLVAVGFGAFGNLTLGGGGQRTLTDRLPDRVTQSICSCTRKRDSITPTRTPLRRASRQDGCSGDGTATTHLTSRTSFPAIDKWFREWLLEHRWTADAYSQSLNILVPDVEFTIDRRKREHSALTIDEPPVTDAVAGTTYFSVTYQIKGG